MTKSYVYLTQFITFIYYLLFFMYLLLSLFSSDYFIKSHAKSTCTQWGQHYVIVLIIKVLFFSGIPSGL